jgi:RNA polymerase-binding transcription factor DksA
MPTNPKKRAAPKFPKGGPAAADRARMRVKLLALRAQLLRSNQDLADEALKGSGQDFSIDHMADHGSDNFEQDVSLALLEGETELLEAIDAALQKIDGNHDLPYGVCEECAEEETWDISPAAPWIPVGRLEVVPYARLCVPHQELREEA